MKEITLLQTSDPVVYADFLKVTGEVNEAFCKKHNLKYRSVLGIIRGRYPWQATFNRIPILYDYLESGYTGWVLYLDADAFVFDLSFGISDYLAGHDDKLIIAARGHNKGKWDINAGVVFYNFGHPSIGDLVRAWHSDFNEQVSEDLLERSHRPWSFKPNDQDLLQSILRNNVEELDSSILIEPKEFLNSWKGSFIRQVLRRDASTLEDRLAMARAAIGEMPHSQSGAPENTST